MEDWSALQTAQAVRTRAVSAREVAEAAMARIEASDGPIHAVVVRDFERALSQADAVDARVKAGEDLPLAGVAMTMKESFAVGGLPACWGIEALRGWVALHDGATAGALKAAGAVILGKTNVPVALADWQSDNPVYGRTNNPLDLTRSPGGSSGGSAAALASRMVPLEFGSDIGGSIRIPAHFCGVFGLKTTYGVIPLHGHPFPGANGAPPLLSVAGPMARDTADIAVALDLTSEVILPRPRLSSLKGARLLALTNHPLAPCDGAIVSRMEQVLARAEAAGATVLRAHADLPDLAELHRSYMPLLLVQLAVRNPTPQGPPLPDLKGWMEMLDRQARTHRALERLFQSVDAVIMPVAGITAFEHTQVDMRERMFPVNGSPEPFAPQFAWISLATYGNLPSLAVPMQRVDGPLPAAFQVICRRFHDHTALAIGGWLAELEAEG